VLEAHDSPDGHPLVYLNRTYHKVSV